MAEVTDRLAMDRTHLANERTLLAYVRTALALVATGVALPKLVASHPALWMVTWALVGLGVATATLGLHRFFVVRKQINEASRPGASAQ